MDDPDSEVSRYLHELRETDEELYREFNRMAHGWQLGLGPVRVQKEVHSGIITWVFITFHLILLAAGVILVFARPPLRELGIAIVVGSIFAFGAFVAQFWAVAVQHERSLYWQVFGSSTYVNELIERRGQLRQKLRALMKDSPVDRERGGRHTDGEA